MYRTILRLVGWAFLGIFFGLFESTVSSFLPGAWGAFHPTFAVAVFLLLRSTPRNAAVFACFAGVATDLFSVNVGTFATARYVLIVLALAHLAETVLTNHSLYVAVALVLAARALDLLTRLIAGSVSFSFMGLIRLGAWDVGLVAVLFLLHLLFARRFFAVRATRLPYG